MDAPAPTLELPRMREVFDALRKGVHLTHAHGQAYQSLKDNAEAYRLLFGNLGFELEFDVRGFAYFTGDGEPSGAARQMMVFVLILVDHLASQGLPVQQSLLNDVFDVAALPHLKGSDRHRQILAQVEIMTPDDLEKKALQPLVRLGFARELGAGNFVFQAPVLRFLDYCQMQGLKSESTLDKTEPIDPAEPTAWKEAPRG